MIKLIYQYSNTYNNLLYYCLYYNLNLLFNGMLNFELK